MKNIPSLALIATLMMPVHAAAQRPVVLTESAYTLGRNNYEAGLAFEYLHKSPFQPSPLPRSLYRLFVLAVHSGVAENVDMDLDWRGGLVGVRSDGFRSFDWGDLIVATKLHFFPQHGSMPAVGLRTSIKLPNTTYHPNRLGSNEFDYFTHVLFTKRWTNAELRSNLGFGIVGDPRAAGQQDDVYSFALAGIFSFTDEIKVFGEVMGVAGYQDNDDKVVVRGGISHTGGSLRWSVYASARIYGNSHDFASAFELSESWGIGLMVKKQFTFDPFQFARQQESDGK